MLEKIVSSEKIMAQPLWKGKENNNYMNEKDVYTIKSGRLLGHSCL